MATQETGLNEALAAERHPRGRDRPGRADRAARRRPAQPHPGPRDPQEPGRDQGHLPPRDARRPGRTSPTTRPGWPAAARAHLRDEFLNAKVGISGANFAIADTGSLVVVESEGNGRMCLTLPRHADLGGRGGEGPAVLAGPGGLPGAAAAQLDRRADEPVHHDLDRRRRRRRAAELPPGAARQRPHRHPGRPDRPAGAALHPLLGLPERVPGLRAGRRPRLRLALPRPDRRDPVPAAARRHQRDRRVAAVRLLALRRLLRGLPGRHQHPRGAGGAAGPVGAGSTSTRSNGPCSGCPPTC